MKRNIWLMLLVCLFPVMAWGSTAVERVRLSDMEDKTRIVFELSHRVSYTVFRLHHPERVVIDMKHTRLKKHAMRGLQSSRFVQHIRHGEHDGVLRMVLDLNQEHLGMRSFLLKKMQGKPPRLVVDLMPQSDDPVTTVKTKKTGRHHVVIAVDPGHGGEDPGAIGPNGLQEKKVTLAIARKLVAMLNDQPGVKAFLTRKNDYFVPLKKRVRLVRQKHADVMISIHADAVRSRKVKGSSVYTLAERGATPDKVAIALAAKENAADEVAGIHHVDEIDDVMVRNILGDMAKRESLNSSQVLAEGMIQSLRKAGEVKYDVPKRARFVVLGALEVPSVLVEVDFISNPRQERKLRTSAYQNKLAKAMLHGCRDFLQRMGMLTKASASKAS